MRVKQQAFEQVFHGRMREIFVEGSMDGSPERGVTPLVSFIVPCYNFGRFLPECIGSILHQTYRNFEILIMDDCSSDDTPEVAASFQDSRVSHVRNEVNVGHLRNYNKGLKMAHGKYIWLISADDYLRKSSALERYVEFLEAHPQVGFAFSRGVSVEDGRETRVIGEWGENDLILEGHEFVCRALSEHMVVAPSVIARKECYDKISAFPLDMPHRGDTYMWCRWALEVDVGYFADAMVSYRLHDRSMMSTLKEECPSLMIRDQITVYWRIKRLAEKAGARRIVNTCLSSITNAYTFGLLSQELAVSKYRITFEECHEALHKNANDNKEEQRIRGRVHAGFADGCYQRGELALASQYYLLSLKDDPMMPSVWAKYCLLRMGRVGKVGRRAVQVLRRKAEQVT